MNDRVFRPTPTSTELENLVTPFLPVVALVFLGTIIAFLGLFAAGNLAVITVGLAAIFGAGLLQVLGTRRAA